LDGALIVPLLGLDDPLPVVPPQAANITATATMIDRRSRVALTSPSFGIKPLWRL
jgi:hypothetical protein